MPDAAELTAQLETTLLAAANEIISALPRLGPPVVLPLHPRTRTRLESGGLLDRLPERPGQEWRVVGVDLLIVEIATGVVVDVLKGVLKG